MKLLLISIIISLSSYYSYASCENETYYNNASVSNIEVSMTFGNLGGRFKSNDDVDDFLACSTNTTNIKDIAQQVVSIGKTYNNRTIQAIQIAKKYNASRLSAELSANVTYINSLNNFTARSTIVITGLIQGSDAMTTSMIVYLLKRLILSYIHQNDTTMDSVSDLNYLMEVRNIWFIPIVNKDTYEAIKTNYDSNNTYTIMKKDQNIADSTCVSPNYGGVNLRFNYPNVTNVTKVVDVCSENYGGSTALSESETNAVIKFIQGLSPNLVLNLAAANKAIFLPFSYLSSTTVATSEYKSLDDVATFNSLFKNFLNSTSLPVSTYYGIYGSNVVGEISDYMYHNKSLNAFSIEIGGGSSTTSTSESYFPDPSTIVSTLQSYFPFFKDMLYRAGPIYSFTVIYQRIGACSRAQRKIYLCNPATDFIYSGKYSLNNTGLAASGSQTIVQIGYNASFTVTNISIALNQTQNYLFSDAKFTNVDFTVEESTSSTFNYINVQIPPIAQQGNVYIGIIAVSSTKTINNGFLSFEVLYFDSGDDSEYFIGEIKDEGSIEDQTDSSTPPWKNSTARIAQDAILIVYFSVISIVVIGIILRRIIIKRFVNQY